MKYSYCYYTMVEKCITEVWLFVLTVDNVWKYLNPKSPGTTKTKFIAHTIGDSVTIRF